MSPPLILVLFQTVLGMSTTDLEVNFNMLNMSIADLDLIS